MPRISYVNGQYLRHDRAGVHIEDRGYQFSDAVYEVIATVGDRLVDENLHFDRLERSLSELGMAMPFSRAHFKIKIAELLRLNRIVNGALYIQVSRGVAKRDHKFPEGVRPAVVMTVRPMVPPARALVENGVGVITVPDIRWQRPDIKSVSLLPNILAKQQAVRKGVYEAWQVDANGMVTEGTSTNAWIVVGDRLVTHAPDHAILNGVTRLALLEMAAAEGLTLEERAFGADEARQADEAFLTSTTAFVMPIVKIDDSVIGDGKPGPRTRALLARYDAHLRSGA
jgi:D-alanine transaminase